MTKYEYLIAHSGMTVSLPACSWHLFQGQMAGCIYHFTGTEVPFNFEVKVRPLLNGLFCKVAIGSKWH